MSKYSGVQTQELENELDSMEQTGATPEADIDLDESSFKKRYGDLRRHMQQTQSNKDAEIERLKGQLDSATRSQIKFPKTDAEIADWSSRYPEVSKVIDTIAQKRANEALEIGSQKIEKLERMEDNIKREKAEAELRHMHPDFDKIRSSQKFHQWVSEQPQWVQDSLYKNSSDARAASRAIDLFKTDHNIRRVKGSGSAAQSVGRTTSSAPSGGGRAKYSESMLEKMTDAEYSKHEPAIMESMQKGQFLYDLSGGAR